MSLASSYVEHWGYGVVDVLDAAVDPDVVHAGVDLVDAKAFVDGVGDLRGKVRPVVGEERDGTPTQRDVLVDEDVGGSGGSELRCCHCVHVGAAPEVVGEEEDVAVGAWGKGQRTEVVDADGDAGAVAYI